MFCIFVPGVKRECVLNDDLYGTNCDKFGFCLLERVLWKNLLLGNTAEKREVHVNVMITS